MANSSQTQHTAKMGSATISTANDFLDGTGTIADLITGATNGTQIKTLIIHGQGSPSQGMIRFFVKKVKKSGGSYILLKEVDVPAITQAATVPSFSAVIPFSHILESGEVLSVSTQNADTFNVFAEAFDITYTTATSYLGSTTEFVAVEGAGQVKTANSNLDGTGTLVTLLTAGSGTTYNGCVIESCVIKAQQTITMGMIRLFWYDGGSGLKLLFHEVPIPAATQGSTQKSFQKEVIQGGGLCIPAGSVILASTQNGENFSVVINGKNWKYV